MRARRAGLDAGAVAAAGVAVASRLSSIAVIAEGAPVAAYRAVRNELPLEALTETERWAAFTFPRVRGGDLEFAARFEGQRFELGAFAIPEPVSGDVIALAEHAAVLVPLTAFDRRCQRVGQGGGFYDRALAAAAEAAGPRGRPAAIGVAYAFQQVDEVPTEPWDIALDAIVTDAGIVVAPNRSHALTLTGDPG